MSRLWCNAISTGAALIAAAGTWYASVRFLKRPEGMMFWASFLFAGAVTGIFVFFIVWGHFQEAARKK